MNVLIACEFSGRVRDAFTKQGHRAVSCDLVPTETPGPHVTGDIMPLLDMTDHWDLMVAFPPCTHLSVSGARWFPEKQADGRQQSAIGFFLTLAAANIPKIAIENPIGIMSTHHRKPDQILQPWQYGHGETKATCLWLKGLPPLTPTDIVPGRAANIHREPPGPDRERMRSLTYQGVADAMATQWGTP